MAVIRGICCRHIRQIQSMQQWNDSTQESQRKRFQHTSCRFRREDLLPYDQKATSTRAKSEPAWLEGVYLGTIWLGNGYIIGADKVVVTAHSIKRRFEEGAYAVGAFGSTPGAPSKFVPSTLGFKIPTSIDVASEEEEDVDEKQVVIDHGDLDEHVVRPKPRDIKSRAFNTIRRILSSMARQNHAEDAGE